MKAESSDLWAALRDAAPLAIPVVPFGMVFGILARQAGMSAAETIFMSVTVFAGASQFLAVTMLGSGAALGQIVLATFMINSRHFFMGASLAPYFRRTRLALILAAAGVLTDESYALSINRFTRSGPSTAYYFCVSLLFYLVWVVCTVVGAMWARSFPDVSRWGLDFAFLGAFIGILGSQVRGRGGLAAMLAAGAVAVAGKVLSPGQWYIAAGALGGAVAGWWVDRRA